MCPGIASHFYPKGVLKWKPARPTMRVGGYNRCIKTSRYHLVTANRFSSLLQPGQRLC